MTFPEMIHGKKPEVAPFIPTDPIEMLKLLLSGEIKEWPQIEQLSNLYQNYMLSAYEKAIPGFGDILKEGAAGTKSLLQEAQPLIKGQIPPDVASQVARSSAFQSLMGGSMGGPMGTALTARDLGLTSLNLMNQGANLLTTGGNAAQRWQGIGSSTILPPTASMYSPQWFTEYMAKQAAAKQATQQYANNVAAAPDPVVSGIAGTVMNLVGAYLGHGMGGGSNTLATSQPSSFGQNYAAAMYGTQPQGLGGAAGSLMSPWKAGSTDMYFPTAQSYNAYMGQSQFLPQSGGFGGAGAGSYWGGPPGSVAVGPLEDYGFGNVSPASNPAATNLFWGENMPTTTGTGNNLFWGF